MNSSNPFFARGVALWCALFLSFLCPASAASIETESIEADGAAPIQNGNLAQAREQALSNALRSAVEKILSSTLSRQASASGIAPVHGRIQPATERYILGYRILKEAEQDGSYVVRVAATVDSGVLKSDLRGLGVPGGQKGGAGNPESMISLSISGAFASHHELLAFRETLEGIPSVRSVTIRFLSQARTEMILRSGADAQSVARELSKRRFRGVPLRVLRVETGTIEIAMKS
jgi:hypothetical protein